MRIAALFIVVIALLSTATFARTGHIAALAVADENATNGSIADISLEIKPGHGGIFIESFPLTKLDTQVSTRFAHETACQKSKVDCSQYDFFYIINTRSSLIGGPSAGGAISVLTYAVLEDLPISNETAMTGTILSGGIIGPVGGVRGKIAAASGNGFDTVLIPAWEMNETGIPLADRYNINIIYIKTVDEAIEQFTGKKPELPEPAEIPQEYLDEMRGISETLCSHAHILKQSVENSDIAYNNTTHNWTSTANQQLIRAVDASNRSAYYSAASFCFGAGTTFHRLSLLFAENETVETELQQVIEQQQKLKEALEKTEIKSVADVEVAMIVTERLADVQTSLRDLANTTDPASTIAYAYERLETARAWMHLFGNIPSKKLDVTPQQLAASCQVKIEEAQERVNYLDYIYPVGSMQADESLRIAFADAQNHEYTLCLLHASQAKAEANAILTAVQVPEDDISIVVAEKLRTVQNQLDKQLDQNAFPILGYSYAEYSKELLATEKYSASLYAEYSLEFSQLDIYFPPKKERFVLDTNALMVFATGSIFGIVIGILLGHGIWKSRQKTHRPKKVPIARNLPGKKR